MDFKTKWPSDMNGKKLDFGDIIHDTTLDYEFAIDFFELHGGLLGPLWYANNGEKYTVNLKLCYKVEDKNEL